MCDRFSTSYLQHLTTENGAGFTTARPVERFRTMEVSLAVLAIQGVLCLAGLFFYVVQSAELWLY